MIRKMSVAGSFYPYKREEIISTFEYFHHIATNKFPNSFHSKVAKALIVPHAGYVYSGFSANLAFENVGFIPKRVVIIGPSHKVAFEGKSIIPFETYETPLGELKGDVSFVEELEKKFDFNPLVVAHAEHATEVQFPFIKHFFPETKIVEIVYGFHPKLEPLIEEILNLDETLLLISTDLSHFYSQEEANVLDAYCIQGMEDLDEKVLFKGEACGMQGLIALLHVSKKLSLKIESIDYRTSGDITGDKSRVVGYYSAIVY